MPLASGIHRINVSQFLIDIVMTLNDKL